MLGAIALVDVLDHLFPSRRGEVDVHVRIGGPALVDEPLEEQVVANRVHPGDPEGVGHDRTGGTPSSMGRNPALLRKAHEVPADEEELREPGLLDDIKLMRELPDDRRRNRVIAPSNTGLAEFDEIAERRLTGGDRKPRKSIALETEFHGARGGDFGCRCHALRPGARRRRIRSRKRRVPGRHRHQLRPRLQVRLPVGSAEVRKRVQRPAMRDGRQDVAEFSIFRPSVMNIVRGDHRQAEFCGERCGLRHEPVVVGQEVMRELEEESARGRASAASKDPSVAFGDRAGPCLIPHQQPPRDLAVSTTGQRNDALSVLGEQRLGEPRHSLGPGEIGMGNEPTEAPIPAGIPRQQHEMRTPLPLPDSTQVLLHDRPMAGQSGPIGARTGRTPLDRRGHACV